MNFLVTISSEANLGEGVKKSEHFVDIICGSPLLVLLRPSAAINGRRSD